MSFNLIPLWGRALIIIAAIMTAIGGYFAWQSHIEGIGDKAGYSRAQGEWMAKEAVITAAAEAKLAAAVAAANAKQKALQDQFDTLAETGRKERASHEQDTASHVAAALAGTERLRAGTDRTCGAVSAGAAPAGAGPGAGTGPAQDDALLPDFSAEIFRFAGDYSAAVSDYNRLLDRYNAARAVCNASE